MESATWLPLVNHERCTKCSLCVNICPTQALVDTGDKIRVIDPKRCNYCGQCELVCPENAIALPYQIVLKKSS